MILKNAQHRSFLLEVISNVLQHLLQLLTFIRADYLVLSIISLAGFFLGKILLVFYNPQELK